MIIGYLEYGEVRIYGSLAHALSEWKYPCDLLSDVIIFYDSDGTYLRPIANFSPKKWFQLKPRVSSVELQRDTGNSEQDSIGYLLMHEASRLAPNPFVSSLEELRLLFPWEEQ